MKVTSTLFCVASLALAGCWTFSETEYPTVTIPEGKGVRVKLSNYRTGVYEYDAVEGHESMTPGESDEQLVSQSKAAQENMSWMLQGSASGRLVSRSVAELTRKGYVIDVRKPQYVIDLKLTGPKLPDDDVMCQFWYGLFSLLTAEKVVVTWTGDLRVLDGETEKVLFQKDLEQTYQVTVWGPIPVASPACSEKVTMASANCWALTALSDTALLEATTFINGRAK